MKSPSHGYSLNRDSLNRDSLNRDSLIFHVDINAFFASVEQIIDPRLSGKPVIVGNGCIASCSYEARAFGLSAGMSLREAVNRCPDVVILDGSEKVYRCFSKRVFEICLEVAPEIETFLDEAYLDLSGTKSLYGDPRQPASWLKSVIHQETGLHVTVGIGRNRMLAKIATKRAKPDGLRWIEPDQEDAFVQALSINDLPGVGPKTSRRLKALNIKTAGDLRTLSESHLTLMFGRIGQTLFKRCRGEDTRVIEKREIPRTISRETTFHKETHDSSEIQGMFYYLTERAMRTVRDRGLEVRTVETSIRYEDFKSETARRTMLHPTRLDRDVYTLVLELYDRIHARRVDLRHIGITLSGFNIHESFQPTLFEPEKQIRQVHLQDTVDAVRRKFGHQSLVVGKSLNLLGKLEQESYGFVLRTPSLTK